MLRALPAPGLLGLLGVRAAPRRRGPRAGEVSAIATGAGSVAWVSLMCSLAFPRVLVRRSRAAVLAALERCRPDGCRRQPMLLSNSAWVLAMASSSVVWPSCISMRVCRKNVLKALKLSDVESFWYQVSFGFSSRSK